MGKGAVTIETATVLVVEDEVLISELISEALHERGFDVYVVSNARDAYRYILSGLPVDVLFTDINLPGEIDGAALAQRVREMWPELPIVFASGRLSLLGHLRTIPCAAFLAKPYSPDQACAAVEELIAVRH